MSRAGQDRSISATRAAPESGEVRMSRITSSMLATAMARPTWTWARVARLRQQVLGAAGDHVLAELEERAQHVGERHHLRPPAVQRDHVGAEARLQRGEAPELVEHHLGDRVALDLDDDPHAVAVGFVAQVGNSFDALFVDQLRDPLDQRRLVDLVGDLADDQRLAVLAHASSTATLARMMIEPRPVA